MITDPVTVTLVCLFYGQKKEKQQHLFQTGIKIAQNHSAIKQEGKFKFLLLSAWYFSSNFCKKKRNEILKKLNRDQGSKEVQSFKKNSIFKIYLLENLAAHI